MTHREVLLAAADLIEKKGKTRGWWARDSRGRRVEWWNPDAIRFCALGAIRRVAGDDYAVEEDARQAVHAHLRLSERRPLTLWSDSHSQAEVVAALRAAAKDQA